MASKGIKFLSLAAVMALMSAGTQSVAISPSSPALGSAKVVQPVNKVQPALLAQEEDGAPQSSTDLSIKAMMQMLRDEGLDIDARMQSARDECRARVTADPGDAGTEEIEQSVEDCAAVEENIIYARAINEMNANRVDNFNTSVAQHNAQVAEAERKQREYELELQRHEAELADSRRQQAEFEREMLAHEEQFGNSSGRAGDEEGDRPSSASSSSQLAQVAPAPNPSASGESARPDETPPASVAKAPSTQTPAIAQGPRQTPTQSSVSDNAGTTPGLSRSTGPSSNRGRVLSQSTGPDQQDDIELAIMEASGPRIALVIGNEAYTGGMGSLANPVNDAVLIGATLRSVGFDVEILTNASQREMKEAVRRLGDRLLVAGENSTGLFYYAGHGVQSDGSNFLIPVGAVIDAESDLELEAVHADGILAQMEEAYISTRIVILDACRNMPLRRRTRNGARGLARMETPNGSFVAYSTSPGSTAADGGGIHSPFAEALAAQMVIPDRPIEVTFREVRREVVEVTSGEQVPWDSSSLLDTFNFVTTR